MRMRKMVNAVVVGSIMVIPLVGVVGSAPAGAIRPPRPPLLPPGPPRLISGAVILPVDLDHLISWMSDCRMIWRHGAPVGDIDNNRGIRAILAFDLTAISSGVTITEAFLKVRKKRFKSGYPFADLGHFQVAILSSCTGTFTDYDRHPSVWFMMGPGHHQIPVMSSLM